MINTDLKPQRTRGRGATPTTNRVSLLRTAGRVVGMVLGSVAILFAFYMFHFVAALAAA